MLDPPLILHGNLHDNCLLVLVVWSLWTWPRGDEKLESAGKKRGLKWRPQEMVKQTGGVVVIVTSPAKGTNAIYHQTRTLNVS